MGSLIPKGVPFTQIANDAITDTSLSPIQFRIYAYLMRRANDEARAYPSQRTIAADIGCNKATVGRAIDALVSQGWVTRHVEDIHDPVTGHQQRHHYTVFGLRPDTLFDRTQKATGRSKQPVASGDQTVRIDEPEPYAETVHKNTQQEHPDNTQLAVVENLSVKSTRTAMKNALVAAMGWNPKEVTPRQWKKVEVAAKELCDIDADPGQVDRRAKVYQINFAGATMTPNALAVNWADLAEPRAPISQRAIGQAATRQRTRDAVKEQLRDR